MSRLGVMRLLAWGLGLLVLAVVLVIGLGHSKSGSGRRAPALPTERIAGPRVTLATLRGKPALVLFWASWCPPCAHEAPEVERFAQSPAGKGRLVTVDYEDDSLSEAKHFIRQYRWTLPVLRDEDGTVGFDYGVSTGLPVTFVLDAEGRIRQELRGPQTVQSLTKALAGASSA